MEASSDLCRWATVARTASPGWCRIVSRTRRRPLLDRFREHFADFDGLVPAYLDSLNAADPLHVGAVEWISLDRWHAGRVVIIGDAAHAAPPHMGEGGSLAAEDALVLAQELRGTDTIQTALHAYEARRRPRVEWVQQQSFAAPERGGFLPAYMTECFENAAIRRSASAMNHCAPSLNRRNARDKDVARSLLLGTARGRCRKLVEVSLIDLEAGDLQRLGKRNVAVAAGLVCRLAQSFNEVLQLSQVSHLL